MNLDKCYQLLGICRGASLDQLKAAYRSLARKWHPDLNPGDLDAPQRFIALNQAYQILLDRTQTDSTHSTSTSTATATSPTTTVRVTRQETPPPAATSAPTNQNDDRLKWQLYSAYIQQVI
jgi:carbohydrate-binding DOMON domain-containing protein